VDNASYPHPIVSVLAYPYLLRVDGAGSRPIHPMYNNYKYY